MKEASAKQDGESTKRYSKSDFLLDKLWSPKTLFDIANLEVGNFYASGENTTSSGGGCLIISWVARWRGLLRRGMQMLTDIPVISAIPGSANSRGSANFNINLSQSVSNNSGAQFDSSIIDKLIGVSIKHENIVKLPPVSKSCLVNITLSVLSMSSVPVYITIEALEKKSRSESEDLTRSSSKPHFYNKSFKWLGKTKFSRLKLEPSNSLKLDFSAFITKGGIFDLKRY